MRLALTAAENPFGLTALRGAPRPDRQLWPDVRGHEPYGFNAYLSDEGVFGPEYEAAAGKEAGASLTRVSAPWAQVRYTAGSWDYSALDRSYKANIQRGIRPLWVLFSTPRRFTIHAGTPAGSAQPGCGSDDYCMNPPREDALSDLTAFARDLVRRYPLSAGVEAWNEPNISNPYWGVEPVDPCRYAGVLRAVHSGVKQASDALPVLGGAMSHTATDAGRMRPRDFLAGMLACDAGTAMDAVSWHPYATLYNSSIAAASRELVDGFAAAGISPATKRFVATEYGFATESPYYTLDDRQQADWIAWQMLIYDADWAGVPLTERTDAAFVHTALVDETPDRWHPWSATFGLARRDTTSGTLVPRPAFCKLRASFGGIGTCPESFTP